MGRVKTEEYGSEGNLFGGFPDLETNPQGERGQEDKLKANLSGERKDKRAASRAKENLTWPTKRLSHPGSEEQHKADRTHWEEGETDDDRHYDAPS